MNGIVVVDTNLLVLLVVGSTSIDYIEKHKRLQGYTPDDFQMLGLLISQFSEIVLLPHILAEASNLVRQIASPARLAVQQSFRTLVETTPELPSRSIYGVQRGEHERLGLTDSMIIHVCGMEIDGINPTLITVDTDLADSVSALGLAVIDYKREFQSQIAAR